MIPHGGKNAKNLSDCPVTPLTFSRRGENYLFHIPIIAMPAMSITLRQMTDSWDIPSAISLYNIDRWGTGYFGINEKGNIEVLPTREKEKAIDIMEVIEEAKQRGLTFPMVIRFQDLLRAPGGDDQQGVPRGHRGSGLQERLSRRVPDQGQPAARSRGGDRRCRAAVPLRHRGRLQARADRRARDRIEDPESLIICNGYKDSSSSGTRCSAASSARRSSSSSRSSRRCDKSSASPRRWASSR